MTLAARSRIPRRRRGADRCRGRRSATTSPRSLARRERGPLGVPMRVAGSAGIRRRRSVAGARARFRVPSPRTVANGGEVAWVVRAGRDGACASQPEVELSDAPTAPDRQRPGAQRSARQHRPVLRPPARAPGPTARRIDLTYRAYGLTGAARVRHLGRGAGRGRRCADRGSPPKNCCARSRDHRAGLRSRSLAPARQASPERRSPGPAAARLAACPAPAAAEPVVDVRRVEFKALSASGRRWTRSPLVCLPGLAETAYRRGRPTIVMADACRHHARTPRTASPSSRARGIRRTRA